MLDRTSFIMHVWINGEIDEITLRYIVIW